MVQPHELEGLFGNKVRTPLNQDARCHYDSGERSEGEKRKKNSQEPAAGARGVCLNRTVSMKVAMGRLMDSTHSIDIWRQTRSRKLKKLRAMQRAAYRSKQLLRQSARHRIGLPLSWTWSGTLGTGDRPGSQLWRRNRRGTRRRRDDRGRLPFIEGKREEKEDSRKRQDESGRTLEGQFLYSVMRSERPRHRVMGGGWRRSYAKR
jgi:hypothetical protein